MITAPGGFAPLCLVVDPAGGDRSRCGIGLAKTHDSEPLKRSLVWHRRLVVKVRAVAVEWLSEPVTAVERLAGGQTSTFKLETSQGAFVLKDRGPEGQARLERFAFDTDVMHHLARSGIAVPTPMLDRRGRPWVIADGHVFTLSRYVGGGDPAAGYAASERWRNVGCALGQLHAALSTYPSDRIEGRTIAPRRSIAAS